MSGLLPLDAWQLALAAALVLVNGAFSMGLQLGLGRQLVVAALRAAVQLTLLGLVLHWVFTRDGWFVTVVWMLFMSAAAGFEAARRSKHRVRGMYRLTFSVTLLTGMSIAFYGLSVVVRVDPWYTPQYAIPILGMILGNMLNGVSLGLDAVLSNLVSQRDRIEALLAHGATVAEASREVVRDSVRTGLIPAINMLVAAGTVSIPGMMTGQILAGSPPEAAARYQLFILFAIAAAVALGTGLVVLLARRMIFDERGRLRLDRIRVAQSGG